MLNQNYPRCIFIRIDCEIWAVKTWVIVALETDITHFPSRSWQWHANSVFYGCVCASLCGFCVEVSRNWEGWGKLKGCGMDGGGRRRWFYKADRTWRRNQAVFLHIPCLRPPAFYSFLITFPWCQPLKQPSAPSLLQLSKDRCLSRDKFPHGRKKK